ncbi:MAG TPA: carboxymuconolactone decarboxylase family protein [Stellaceae bacterium]|nr:carboxymuconolactone decarboxylase family protein [Stellaceae bacterium]
MSGRADLRKRGEALRRELFGPEPAGVALTMPMAEFPELMAELVYGSVWTRPGLGRQERMACTLAALVALQNPAALASHCEAALEIGMEPRAIVEIAIQSGIYRGFAASEAALEAVRGVFEARGIVLPASEGASHSLKELTRLGREVQTALHRERSDEGHANPANPTTGSIYPLIVQFCYGAIWNRPGLDRRARALAAVAAFTVLGRELLLRKFALSALNVGATREEVVEAVVQTGPYGGFAFMLSGLSAVGEAFAASAPKPAR